MTKILKRVKDGTGIRIYAYCPVCGDKEAPSDRAEFLAEHFYFHALEKLARSPKEKTKR